MKGSSHQKKKKKNTNRIQYSPKGCTVSPVSDSFKLILIRNVYAPVTWPRIMSLYGQHAVATFKWIVCLISVSLCLVSTTRLHSLRTNHLWEDTAVEKPGGGSCNFSHSITLLFFWVISPTSELTRPESLEAEHTLKDLSEYLTTWSPCKAAQSYTVPREHCFRNDDWKGQTGSITSLQSYLYHYLYTACCSRSKRTLMNDKYNILIPSAF